MPTILREGPVGSEIRVAVLMAAFNGAKWLPTQLSSILGQRGVTVHIFVSLDQSTDRSLELLRELASQDDRLTLLPYGERFGGASRNFFRLFRDAPIDDYQFVSLADQDDVWHPQKLARAVRQLAISGAEGYSSNVTATWANGRHRLVAKAQRQRRFDHVFEGPGPGCTFVLGQRLAVAIRLRTRDSSGFIDRVDWHDWAIYSFARSAGFAWVIDAYPSMEYRQHVGNLLGSNTGLKAIVRRMGDLFEGNALVQVRLVAKFSGSGLSPIVGRVVQYRFLSFLEMMLRTGLFRRRLADRLIFFFAAPFLYLAWRRRSPSARDSV